MWHAPLLRLARRQRRRWPLDASGKWRGAAASASAPPPPPPAPDPPPPAPPHHPHHHHHVRVAEQQPDPYIGGYTPVTKALWRSRLSWHSAPSGAQGGGGDGRAPPPPRSVVVSLPFSRDAVLRDNYANPWGFVRLGRLLEDLDSLSGTAAFAHVASAPVAEAPSSSPPPAPPPTQPPPAPPLPQLVTASVDAITLERPLRLDHDLRMTARVVWTGSSSLDVRMEVTQEEEGGEDRAAGAPTDATGDAEAAATTTTTTAPTTARPTPPPSLVALFSYVALDRQTRRPVRVPPLVPATDEERAWFEERRRVAEERRRLRQAQKEASDSGRRHPQQQQPPQEEAETAGGGTARRAELMRRFAAAAARLADLPALSPPRLLPVSLTRVDNALVTQPQQRNTAGRVFGGFLMRRAFELSFAAAFLFAGCRPAFVRCEDVSFASPVDVGDLMRFSARVLAAWRPPGGAGAEAGAAAAATDGGDGSSSSSYLVAVEAVAERARPDRRTVATTNTFRYIFRCRPGGRAASPPPPPPPLLRMPIPTTAEDARRVASMLAELSDADVAAVAAELDAAERE